MNHNIQLEQNILGSIMFLNGFGESVQKAISELSESHFYYAQHKEIFSLMKSLDSSGKCPSPSEIAVLISDESYAYTMEVWKNTSSAVGLDGWVDTLKQYKYLRDTQDKVNSLNEIINSTMAVDEKIKESEILFDADTGFTSSEVGAKHISECADSYLDYLEKRWTNPDEVVFTTGIEGLDSILGGGHEVGLHVIAARPKMGKTELMGKMVNHYAIDRQLPVYVGSLEMPEDQVMHRLTSSLSRVGKDEIKDNFITNGQFDELSQGIFTKALSDLSKTKTYIDARHSNTVRKVRRECLKIHKKHGKVGGIFVDYLGLLEIDGTFSRHDLAIAAMTRALKGMSKEFECPVILLIQLNRKLEDRQDKRPQPSDSRDSGAIEQDCDSWTTIYRDSVYHEDSPWGNITEVIVRLNRHGGTGTAYQILTSAGFKDVDENEVANAVHKEQSKNQGNSTSNF